ncbi:MAG: ABC transporter permease [Lachnospirales bacterium]
MRSFFIVLSFELLGFLKHKKNWIITMISVAVLAIFSVMPIFVDYVKSNIDEKKIGIIIGDIEYIDIECEVFSGFYDDPTIQSDCVIYEDYSELRRDLIDGKLKDYYYFDNDEIRHYTTSYYINSTSTDYVVQIFRKYYVTAKMEEVGIIEAQVEINEYFNSLRPVEVSVGTNNIIEEVDLNDDTVFMEFAIGYIFITFMYISIAQYGSYVTTSVANEKLSKTMESLISSTKIKYLITGKVIGVFFGGLIQMGTILIATLISLHFGAVNALDVTNVTGMLSGDSNIYTTLISGLTAKYVFNFIFFYLFGYLIYLFIYAAFAATVSKAEDISASVSIATYTFLIALFSAIFVLMIGDNTILRFISYIPPFTPLTMFARYTLGTASNMEMTYAYFALVLFSWYSAYIAIRIYKFGVLNYGNKLSSFRVIQKSVFKK